MCRGTEDGDLAKDFHRNCDGKAPTIISCKDTKNQIFGGYTEAEWDSENRHKKRDRNSFIFSVTQILNLIVIIMIIPLNVIVTLDLSSVLEVILLLLIVSFK